MLTISPVRPRVLRSIRSAGIAMLLFLCARTGLAGEAIRVGQTRLFGEMRNPEFVKHDRSAAYFREQGIALSLMSLEDFVRRDLSAETLAARLHAFHVVVLQTEPEGIYRFDEAHSTRAARIGEALRAYVEGGGGLLLQISSVRYLAGDDLAYWNAVMQPLNVRILPEGIFDPSQTTGPVFTKPEGSHGRGENQFFHTSNIRSHEVTAGISGLWLPLLSFAPMAGTPAMEYGTEWTPIVLGGPGAKSYRMKTGGGGGFYEVDLQSPGTYATEPPIVAVRTLGRGRIAALPVDFVFTGRNYGNPFWLDIVESGDPVSGKRSDMMPLQSQLFQWLSAASRNDARFGTHRDPPASRVEFPASVEWQVPSLPAPRPGFRGLLGAVSVHGGGESTVAEYVAAAKAAGLSFIVFADPLENLTPEKLAALQEDCRTHSNETFYACPGVEFTDGSGIRWAMWGEKVGFPRDSFSRDFGTERGLGVVTYTQWDGKTVRHYGQYAAAGGFSPSAVIDYKQMRSVGVIPENLWHFFNTFPHVYDVDRLAADNFEEHKRALRDLRRVVPMSFTRIRNASQVADAVRASFTTIGTADAVRRILNSRVSQQFFLAARYGLTVSYESSAALSWNVINSQMESHFEKTRGAQRVILQFTAQSPDGIRELRVIDADQGIIRRFQAPEGAMRLSETVELTHDRQRWLMLEAICGRGGRALSSPIQVFCYKQGLFRCTDNLNIHGPVGFATHPDRNESLPLVQNFRNAEQHSIQGWDRTRADLPMPIGRRSDSVFFAETAADWPWGFPHSEKVMIRRPMEVVLAGHDMQVLRMRKDSLVERFDNRQRPGPSMASPARRVADNEYFESEEMLIAPRDRKDHFLDWNHRRHFQSLETWNGSFMWHEGTIRFKRDVTLNRHGGVTLGFVTFPFDLAKGTGTMFLSRDAQRQEHPRAVPCVSGTGTMILSHGTQQGVVSDAITAPRQTLTRQGKVAPGGFIAQMNSIVGYIGIFPAIGSERVAYRSILPGRLEFGLGQDGEVIRAGTVLRYAFLAGAIPDQALSVTRMDDIARIFNLAGGTNGYPVEMQTGTLECAVFLFTVRAVNQEASFRLGPEKGVGIDLPIRVRGLQDNGVAAVHSEARPWFHFVPVLDGTAWFQAPIDEANTIWAGNVFVCDHPEIRMTLVEDGLEAGAAPFLEIHNPTSQSVDANIHSPPGTPRHGGTAFRAHIPAGSSIRHPLGRIVRQD